MPRTRSLVWSELRVGVLTVVAILITLVTVFTLTGSRGFFWQRYKLKTRFDNVAGLNTGAPVRVAGFEVGQVTEMAFVGEKVDITLEVNKDQRQRITDRSVAKLGSVSLLGQAAVDITPSLQGTPVPEWGYVTSTKPPSQISDITDQASQGITELTKLITDVRAGKGTIGKLMTEDALYAELKTFVATAGDVVRGVQQGQGTIGRLLKDRKTADALEASVKNLEELTRRINAGEGSIGRLLNDDAFARSLTDTTANLKDLTNSAKGLTDRLNRGEGTAGKLMTDASLFNRLTAVSGRFDDLLNHLNEGQGTAGQLLKDKQLYENMNGAVADLRTLLSNIQKDPRKYLNIKVSIF
jgi:phospholipid/cholesterol/gamma-HCH transport system substrate-binding protein